MAYYNDLIRIQLPNDLAQRLGKALRKAGSREIGGILMGEHLSENRFLVRDLSIQRQGGTLASFVRAAQRVVGFVKRFFQETGHDYVRFNYLGEWHSHPSFPPTPSATDSDTMWSIVGDAEVGANFAVLMIVRLNENDVLEGTASLFLPDRRVLAGTLLFEEK